MKRKYILLCMALCGFTILATGCNSKENEVVSLSEIVSQSQESASNYSQTVSNSNILSIQDELAQVQAEVDEKNDIDSGNMTQTDMNIHSQEVYELWDNALNRLWSRLIREIDPTKQGDILDEQQAWLNKRALAMKWAGQQALGGTLQPLLESSTGASLTRVRVYELGKALAEVRNQSFEISDALANELALADPDLETVLSSFEGQWFFDTTRGAVIGIERFDDSAFAAERDIYGEDANWIIWQTGGDILTDLDVYCTTPDSVFFQYKNHYYQLRRNMEGNVELAFGDSLDELNEVYTCE